MPNFMQAQRPSVMPMVENAAKPVRLIGVPCGAGAGRAGCERAPAAFRARDLAGRIAAGDRRVAGDSDVIFTPELALVPDHARAHNVGAVVAAVRATHRDTFHALQGGEFPLILGGDHSISMGSVSAASRHASTLGKRLALIWLDAHADFNTPETSPSGNLHGMSLAQLTGQSCLATLMGPQGFTPIRPEDITIIGLRSVDEDEAQALASTGIRHYSPTEIRKRGMNAVIEETLLGIDPATIRLHVSLDLDVIDPAFVPGVGTPVPGGLDPAELLEAAMMFAASGVMASADIVELNPSCDHQGRTADLAVALASALLGVPAGS